MATIERPLATDPRSGPLAHSPARPAPAQPLNGAAPAVPPAPTADASAAVSPVPRPVGRPPARRPSRAWPMFVGGLIVFAGAKEVLRQLEESPIALQAHIMSRREAGIGVAMLMRVVQWIGEGALGVRRARL